MSQEKMSSSLQEGLVTLLCYNDQYAKIILNSLDVSLFEGDFKTVATPIYDYIRRSGKAPKDHVVDLMDDILSKKDKKADHFKALLKHVRRFSKSINPEHFMGRLGALIRRQELLKATLEVADIINSGRLDDQAMERIETVFTKAIKKKMEAFDQGTLLGDSKRALKFLDPKEGDFFPTGIPELDSKSLGPSRKALHLFIGLPKSGKTWWLINLGKQAYKAGLKVLHVTLEMNEEQISKRYYQALYAISKRRPIRERDKFIRVSFKTSEQGYLEDLRFKQFDPKATLEDENIREILDRKLRHSGKRMSRIVIKEFPTRQLTLNGLETYLNNLEMQHGFVPDLLLLDYPQLMKIEGKDHRLEVGKVIQSLRGIAMERNIGVATVAQSHRKALKMKHVELGNIAEDFSQVATADIILTLSQTTQEHLLGLARILVAAARDEEDQFSILVAQHYATGQFCKSSIRVPKQYWDILEGHDISDDRDEDEEDDRNNDPVI